MSNPPISVLFSRPKTDISLQIFSFIHDLSKNTNLIQGQTLEIEAKLGQLVDKHTNQRINLPVGSETILLETQQFFFKADMTITQHRSFNQLLNNIVDKGKDGLKVVGYKHTYQTDLFYKLGNRKIRTTVQGDVTTSNIE
jgi:hypothetical protein